MLEKEKAIDAVLIATPDHLHAYVSILAMKAGKHVYCEKPLTHNVWEARTVARVATETGVATQMGNQGRSGEGHRQTAEWIWDGAIGAVREVHAWSGSRAASRRDAGARGHARRCRRASTGTCGSGPASRARTTPPTRPCSWRGFWAFGGGALPDMAIHHLDPAFNALELDTPQTVEATAPGGVDAEVCSARGARRPGASPPAGTGGRVTVHWYDGGLRPPTPPGDRPRRPEAAARRGRQRHPLRRREGDHHLRGLVRHAPPAAARAAPRATSARAKTLPRVEGHHADWLQACKGGPPASSNFDYGARLVRVHPARQRGAPRAASSSGGTARA